MIIWTFFQTYDDKSIYKKCYLPNAVRPRSFSYLPGRRKNGRRKSGKRKVGKGKMGEGKMGKRKMRKGKVEKGKLEKGKLEKETFVIHTKE